MTTPGSVLSEVGTAGLVAEQFPSFVRTSVLPLGQQPQGQVWDEELRAVADAVPSRRREFLAGRACAHAALAALGRDEGPVVVGRRREPVWPPGVVGSISHAGGWCGAAVALASEAWGLGLDIEVLDPPLEPGVERLVMSAGELRQMAAVTNHHPLAPYATKIAFSAKECVLKCLSPRAQGLIDLTEVTVELDLSRSCFRATLVGELRRSFPISYGLEGSLRAAGGHVFTTLCPRR